MRVLKSLLFTFLLYVSVYRKYGIIKEMVRVMPDCFAIFFWSRLAIPSITVIFLLEVENKVFYYYFDIKIIFIGCTLCQALPRALNRLCYSVFWFTKQAEFSRRGAESNFILSHTSPSKLTLWIIDVCLPP